MASDKLTLECIRAGNGNGCLFAQDRCGLHKIFQRNLEVECAPLAHLAAHANGATHAIDQFATDRKTKARATKSTRNRRIDLRKVTEKITLILIGNTDAGIFDADEQPITHPVTQARDIQENMTAGRKFNRIADQIEQNLSQAARITRDLTRHIRRNGAAQNQIFFGRFIAQNIKRAEQFAEQVKADGFKADLIRIKLGHIQNIAQQRQQMLGQFTCNLDIAALHMIERRCRDQIGHADNACNRRADFMTHRCQKCRAYTTGGFRTVARFQKHVLTATAFGNIGYCFDKATISQRRGAYFQNTLGPIFNLQTRLECPAKFFLKLQQLQIGIKNRHRKL